MLGTLHSFRIFKWFQLLLKTIVSLFLTKNNIILNLKFSLEIFFFRQPGDLYLQKVYSGFAVVFFKQASAVNKTSDD